VVYLYMQKAVKSLTVIPGVGPKNAQLLEAAGYTDVEGIQNFYDSHCKRDADLLQKHLQVGLVWKMQWCCPMGYGIALHPDDDCIRGQLHWASKPRLPDEVQSLYTQGLQD
jgi:hypothetical protein